MTEEQINQLLADVGRIADALENAFPQRQQRRPARERQDIDVIREIAQQVTYDVLEAEKAKKK